jgi:hypothetical protein
MSSSAIDPAGLDHLHATSKIFPSNPTSDRFLFVLSNISKIIHPTSGKFLHSIFLLCRVWLLLVASRRILSPSLDDRRVKLAPYLTLGIKFCRVCSCKADNFGRSMFNHFLFFFMRKVEDKMGENKIRRAIVALKWSYFYWPLPLVRRCDGSFCFPASKYAA